MEAKLFTTCRKHFQHNHPLPTALPAKPPCTYCTSNITTLYLLHNKTTPYLLHYQQNHPVPTALHHPVSAYLLTQPYLVPSLNTSAHQYTHLNLLYVVVPFCSRLLINLHLGWVHRSGHSWSGCGSRSGVSSGLCQLVHEWAVTGKV